MFTRLRLENFKSFREADLQLGPLTVLVGTNASGKSNLRDAFRFLQAASRGYAPPDILGRKISASGYREWDGIRGGSSEISHHGARRFSIGTDIRVKKQGVEQDYAHKFALQDFSRDPFQWIWSFERELITAEPQKQTLLESFLDELGRVHFNFDPSEDGTTEVTLPQRDVPGLAIRNINNPVTIPHEWIMTPTASVKRAREAASRIIRHYEGVRFLELDPKELRIPSLPGQIVLGEHGENLASLIEAITQEEEMKGNVLDWLGELTPAEIVDIGLGYDLEGKVSFNLVEAGNHRRSVQSTSDGTLRFLALLALLLGPEPPPFLFLEEIETGLHPTRLHLLVQLLEQVTSSGKTQIVATTHSPLVLHYLSEATFENATLTYRLPHEAQTRVKRLVDIPNARQNFQEFDPAELYASGWLETAVDFTQPESENVQNELQDVFEAAA